jgi:flagellar basal body-associated protein FliL
MSNTTNTTNRPQRKSHRPLDLAVSTLVILLILAVLVGVTYSVVNLSKSSPKHSTTAHSHTRASNKPSTAYQPTTTTKNSNSNQSSSNSQLTNTGPGDAEVVVFVSVVSIGTLAHYTIRRIKLSNS